MASTAVDGLRHSAARVRWSRRLPYVVARRLVAIAMVVLLVLGLVYLASGV
jgi:hypothetical protein